MFRLDFHRNLGTALGVGREGGFNVYHRFQALVRLNFHRYLGSGLGPVQTNAFSLSTKTQPSIRVF